MPGIASHMILSLFFRNVKELNIENLIGEEEEHVQTVPLQNQATGAFPCTTLVGTGICSPGASFLRLIDILAFRGTMTMSPYQSFGGLSWGSGCNS